MPRLLLLLPTLPRLLLLPLPRLLLKKKNQPT